MTLLESRAICPSHPNLAAAPETWGGAGSAATPPELGTLTTLTTWFALTLPSVTGFAVLAAKWSLLTAVSIYAALFVLAAVVAVVPAGWGRGVGGGSR